MTTSTWNSINKTFVSFLQCPNKTKVSGDFWLKLRDYNFVAVLASSLGTCRVISW